LKIIQWVGVYHSCSKCPHGYSFGQKNELLRPYGVILWKEKIIS
jgi:hypothetical protein